MLPTAGGYSGRVFDALVLASLVVLAETLSSLAFVLGIMKKKCIFRHVFCASGSLDNLIA